MWLAELISISYFQFHTSENTCGARDSDQTHRAPKRQTSWRYRGMAIEMTSKFVFENTFEDVTRQKAALFIMHQSSHFFVLPLLLPHTPTFVPLFVPPPFPLVPPLVLLFSFVCCSLISSPPKLFRALSCESFVFPCYASVRTLIISMQASCASQVLLIFLQQHDSFAAHFLKFQTFQWLWQH